LFNQQPHILVVDDDDRIRTLVTRYLWKNNFVCLNADSGEAALEILKEFDVDLMVADVMMQGMSGLDLTQKVRKAYNALPVILLTALGEVENRIEGLEKGADDYLSKPFEPKELVLRIQALLRRSGKKTDASRVHIGSFEFNKESSTLQSGAEVIRLTELENRLLQSFLKNKNEPVSRDVLAELCDMKGSERAIDVQITRLRKKMETDPSNPRYLKTVRGKGYMLKE
jgi:two-component system phosphate regulon response regulator OmpR